MPEQWSAGDLTGDPPARTGRGGPWRWVAAVAVLLLLVVGVVALTRHPGAAPQRDLGTTVRSDNQPPASPGSASAAPGSPAPSSSTRPPTTAPATTRRATTPPAPPPTGQHCANPKFVTSDHNGGWSTGGYYVHNNMWNDSVPLGPETLYACAFDNWYVVSDQTDDAGAVKTYPNVHKDYSDAPISSFGGISTSFAATSPHTGIYDVAYDIWTNGVATSGSTEIMIWTENFHQVPAGSKTTTVTFGGRSYAVWKTPDSHYIAFVPSTPMASGTIDLLEIFKWIIGRGWLGASATLGQICYGVEIVSTNGVKQTFTFSDFSITSS